MADSDDEVRMTLRLPAKLRDQLAQSAARSGRSLNGEIVYRLETWHKPSQKLTEEEKEDLWQWLQERAKADEERK